MAFQRCISSIIAVVVLAMAMSLSTDSVIVAPGDTLSELAAANGVAIADLIEWNNISDPDLILVGRDLIVSDPAAAATGGSRAATQSGGVSGTPVASNYIVRAGDTLSAIAHRFGKSILRIMELNAISNPDLIYTGRTIHLDSDQNPDLVSDPSSIRAGYTVVSGDTLSGIAARFGVSMATLAVVNSLSNTDFIMVGTQLVIPADPTVLPNPEPVASTTTTNPPETSTTTSPPIATTTTTIADVTTTQAPMGTVPPTSTTASPAPAGTVPDPSVIGSTSLSPLFEKWANIYSVPRGLLEALAWKESNWRPDAIGAGGHLGISQISPSTIAFIEANLLGLRTDPLAPSDGIRLEARYLRYLIDRTTNEREALAAWNQGLHDLLTSGISESGSDFADDVLAIRDARA